jgi:hypothetical protein
MMAGPQDLDDSGRRRPSQGMPVVRADAGVDAGDLQPTGLSRSGGVAAVLVAVMLLAGLVGFAVPLPGLGLRNWLIVLFQINARVGALPADPLRAFNALDVAVLVLVGLTFLGFWPVLGRVNRIWIAIAVALPFAGIAVLLVTNLAGRSSVMGAGLVIAFLMLESRAFKPLAYPGILANALLLAGDLATGGSRAPVVAALVGVGYVLLTAWFLLIGARLLGWGR